MSGRKAFHKITAMVLFAVMVAGMMPVPGQAETVTIPIGTRGEIIAFEALEPDITMQIVPLGTTEANLNLPNNLTVTIRRADVEEEPAEEAAGSPVEITAPLPVTWASSPEYDGNASGTYVFSPQLPAGLTLADDADMLFIAVSVAPALDAVAGNAVSISYIDRYGRQQTVKAKELTTDYAHIHLSDGWYYIAGDIYVHGSIYINGDVKIILADGSKCTVNAGVNVWEGNNYNIPKRSLTIYGQSEGTGTLNAQGNWNGSAGIGGDIHQGAGDITIVGGRINAYGSVGSNGASGAGIGGGPFGRGASFTMYGGVVTAVGSVTAAGLGGGTRASGNTVRIFGGVLSAVGGNQGAGIGGGLSDNGSDVYIYGGTITASGNIYGAGIGGGKDGHGGNVFINGGSVKAVGGSYGASNIGPGVGPGRSGYIRNSRFESLYLNILTLPDKPNTMITAIYTKPDLSYGIQDMKTDENGNIYLYLPESDGKELIGLTADGTAYFSIYERKGNLTQSLHTAPQNWDEVQAFLDVVNNEGILDLSGFTTPENDKEYIFNVGSTKNITIRGNGTQIQNIAFIFGSSNTITIENLNIRSANNLGGFSLNECTAPLYFNGNDNTLVVKGTNTITNGQYSVQSGLGSAIGVASFKNLTIKAVPGDKTAILNVCSNGPMVPAIGNGYNKYTGFVTIEDVTVNRSWERPRAGLGDSGGNSGGDSGSDDTSFDTSDKPSYVTISPQDPNQPVTVSAPVTATAGTNGTASAAIPDKSITEAIANAQEEVKKQGNTANGISVYLDVRIPEGASSLSLTITHASLSSLVSANVKRFEIYSSIVSLDIDQEVLKEILKQSTGSVSITVKPVKSLSAAAKEFIGTRPAYDVTISGVKDGNTVTIASLGMGSVILSIPYTPGKNEAIGWLYGVHEDAEGKAERVPGSAYDADSGSLILSSDHLSVYGVGYTAPAEKYTDIASHWAKESIDYAVGRGLFSGTSDAEFSPDLTIDRGMLVTVLGRLAGADVIVYETGSFSDVAEGRYYQPYVEWAYKIGIVNGIGNGRFAPERAVSREEIALLLHNYARATGYTLPVIYETAVFADHSSIGDPYIDAVRALQQAGIMTGDNSNKFNPGIKATRAEVAAILHRYIKLTIDPATAQGWAKNDDGRYMYYKDGKPLTGWQTIDGAKYSFHGTGALQTGWVKDGDSWRFYSGNKAFVGWLKIGPEGSEKTYYFTEDSIMASSEWLEMDRKWYYFYVHGSLARSTVIDGYEIDENGVRKNE